MAAGEPVTDLDARYSSADASPTAWPDARERLADAELYWLSTVRPDGQPNVAPLLSVWVDGAPCFCTGETERKARNVEHNPRCVLSTGTNTLDEGFDIMVEGDAERISDKRTLDRVAAAYEDKYGPEWHFDVRDGAFSVEGGRALVFRLDPHKAFGFGRSMPDHERSAAERAAKRQPGEGEYSQTRWRFDAEK